MLPGGVDKPSHTHTRSIAFGYVVGGITTLLALPIIAVLRRLGERSDIMIGTAGSQAGCGGQGLPDISSLDTTPRTPAGLEA